MASRPVFISTGPDRGLIRTVAVEFEWFPGFAASQKQKSIASLHDAALSEVGPGRYLEISSKSPNLQGTQLSAFHLIVEGFAEHSVAVENAFQGSKAFELGGPYTDLYKVSPLEAKRDPRLQTSGALTHFETPRESWPLSPQTAFYDWVYIRALTDDPRLLKRIEEFSGFTDIEFNPRKSLNCQARSCALALALVQHDLLGIAMDSQAAFIDTCYPSGPFQQMMQLE